MKNFAVAVSLLLITVAAAPQTASAQTDSSRWMGELANDPRYPAGGPSPMDQSLAEFIFPGTHDSGSYRVRLAVACDACRDAPLGEMIEQSGPLAEFVAVLASPWAKTQDLDIQGQLERGARALDLRFFRADASDIAESVPVFNNLAAAITAAGFGEQFELQPLTQGEFYIHHTFAGPSAAEIFASIQAFLAEADRQDEIIILSFSAMNEGSGEMSPASLRDFFRQLFDAIGTSYFAPASNGQTTLRTLRNAGQQIVVTLDSNSVPAWQPGVDDDVSNLVWPTLAKAYVGSTAVNPAGGYPVADDWNTEGRLFDWLKTIGEQRADPAEMFQMAVQMGLDDDDFYGAPLMISRRLFCNPTELNTIMLEGLAGYIEAYTGVALSTEMLVAFTAVDTYGGGTSSPRDALFDAATDAAKLVAYEEAMDEAGICPAINDDWDRLRSLEEVAEFTNHKVLPALVGLNRDDVNIVLADFYPVQFTTEAMKLNRGAARVTFIVKNVEELECHDCFPPNGPSNPDYYPLIDFAGDEWPRWGGPWLEKSGTYITPNWTAYRAVPAHVPSVDVTLRINDQDNVLLPGEFPDINTDDHSQINGDAVTLTTTRPVWACEGPGCTVSLSYAGENLVSSGDTGLFEYDSSRISYGIGVCQWSRAPGETDRSSGCGPFTDNTPPIAEFSDLPGNPLCLSVACVIEGNVIGPFHGIGSDPDPEFINCDQDGNCDSVGWIVSYEWDCAYDGTDFVPLRGCVDADVTMINADIHAAESFIRFRSPDGPRDLVLGLRAIDVGGAVSAVATVPYQVLNFTPVVNLSGLVVTQTGATTVTAVGTFWDQGVDDKPFTCFFRAPNHGISIAPEPATKLAASNYECKIELTYSVPGTYEFRFWVRDKDGAESTGFSLAQAEVLGPQVTNFSDVMTAGSLRNTLNQAIAGDVIRFDQSLSGQTITLTEGELSIIPSLNVTIDASSLQDGLTISGNDASRVFTIYAGGTLALKGLTISGGDDFNAGCIWNGGTLDIVDSTITGCNGYLASGILNVPTGSMTLTNTTVSGNQHIVGGAIMNQGVVTLNQSTVSDNHGLVTQDAATGGIYNEATLNIENSIVAGNTGNNGDIAGIQGSINASGRNLIGDNSSVETEFPEGPLVGTVANPLDPQLDPLGDNGGPTPTMLPVLGSPAIDAAIVTDDWQATDQRGVARPVGIANDLGAVERQASDVVPDTDGDTVPDAIDNCPAIANSNQLDTDSDGFGEVCDRRVVSLGDIDGSGAAEVAVLVPGTTTTVQVRDGLTDALISTIDFGADPVVAVEVIDDISGNGAPEIAVLGTRPSGDVRVNIKDSLTGAAVNTIFYGSAFAAVDMAVIPDTNSNGAAELAVLGRNDVGGVRVQARDALDDAETSTTYYGTKADPLELQVLPDINSNGAPEVVVQARIPSSGQTRAQIKDTASGALIRQVFFGAAYTPLQLAVVDDVSGDGLPDLAQLGRIDATGAMRVQIKASSGGPVISNAFLGDADIPVQMVGIGDANSNGFPDTAILVERPDGSGKVILRDGATGDFIGNVFFGSIVAPAGLTLVGDLDVSGDPELAALGESAGVNRVQIRDSVSGAQVNSIDYP